MEPLKSKKILVIVEGDNTEPKLFQQMSKVFELRFEIISFHTNIYTLYKELLKENFECDIVTILKQRARTEEEKLLLEQRFTYIYLIFDCDAHHTEYNETLTKEVFLKNFDRLMEMANHFTDETDPTIGKLYINYPMIESYKDCNGFWDDAYKDNFIPVLDVPKYKSLVGKRKNSNIKVSCYTRDDFQSLMKMNIFKLHYLIQTKWESLPYSDYMKYQGETQIVELEQSLVQNQSLIAVLNTSLFLLLDYYANRDGFYDSIVNTPEHENLTELHT